MLYISKGAVLKPCDINKISVSLRGCEYTLTNLQAKLWLAGRFRIGHVNHALQKTALHSLGEQGLVEVSDNEGELSDYRLLINCIFCSTAYNTPLYILNNTEKMILKWLTHAGGKLTLSELVLLTEKGIEPKLSLVGKENWQNLVEAIYTNEIIFDGILATQMEGSPSRKKTVNALLGLLRKKRIILV